VTAVGVVNNIPLDEGTSGIRVTAEGMSSGESDGSLVNMNFTGGDYFRALGISLLQGRTFTNDEAVTPNSNVVVSRSAAEKLWPSQTPRGRRRLQRFGGRDTLTFTVVGVVEDVKQNDWREAGQALIY